MIRISRKKRWRGGVKGGEKRGGVINYHSIQMKQIMNTPLRYDLIEREKRNHDLNSSRTNDGNLKELIIDRFRYKPIDLLIKHFPSFVSLKVILFFRSSWLIVVTNYRIICIWRNAVGINEASFRMHAVFNIMQMLAIALTISISSISFFFIFFFFYIFHWHRFDSFREYN